MPTPESPLRLQTEKRGDVEIVHAAGRLDVPLDRLFRKCIESLGSRVVVDGAGLEYLSSRGVSVFIAVVDDLRARGGDLKIAAVPKHGRVVIDRLGVSRLLQTFDTVEEAIRAFETPIEEFLSAGGLETFYASKGGKAFHAGACGSARRIRARVSFASKKDARAAGLKPCRRCS